MIGRPNPTPSPHKWILAALVLLVVLMPLIEYFWFSLSQREIEQRQEMQLTAIAGDKANQIAVWRDERVTDALQVADSIAALADESGGFSRVQKVAEILQTAIAAPGYGAAFVLGPQDEVSAAGGAPVPAEGALAAQVIRTGRAAVTDYWLDGVLRVGLAAPIPSAGESTNAVVLRIDPYTHLYPSLLKWPLVSETAEVLLVRGEGSAVVFLSQLRFQPERSGVRRPLDAPGLVAAVAAGGGEGLTAGVDYRGEAVFAALRSIRDTPWAIVAKVDRAEALAPVRELALRGAVGSLLLSALAAGLVAFWWRYQKTAFRLRLSEVEVQRLALERHYDYLAKYANDIILLADPAGWLIAANDQAVRAYGYTREELLRLRWGDLTKPGELPDFSRRWDEAVEPDALLYEIQQQRADGSTFPAEVSARVIEADGESLYQAIIRDITERKAAEGKVARLTQLYAALSHTNAAIIRATGRARLFQEVCGIAVREGPFGAAWIGEVDPEAGRVRRVAACGERQGPPYLPLPLEAADPIAEALSRALTEDGVRIGETDDEQVIRRWDGVRTVAALPLHCDSRVIGLMVVCAGGHDFFDPQLLRLLEEMAADISFALSGLAREELRRTAESALRENEERLRLVLEGSSDGFWDWDVGNDHIYFSPRYIEMLGYRQDELEPRYASWEGLIHPGDRPATTKALETHWKGRSKHFEVEHRMRSRSGQWRWILTRGKLVARDAAGKPARMAGAISDITERKEAEERIHFLSHHDLLTGLPNRALLHERGAQLLSAGQKNQHGAALLVLDLDRFKSVNDRFGEPVGDEILREVALRLTEAAGPEDTVGRQAGDRFAVLLPRIANAADAAHTAQAIIETLGRPFRVAEEEVLLSCSIGIATFPEDGDHIDSLLKNAEVALVYAKELGRNNYQFFSKELNARVGEWLMLENDLRWAIERGELFLEYQPQYDIRDGRMVGVEALVRWRHPSKGVIAPGTFMPLAEESGLMVRIGEWVLREACVQQGKWRAEGLPAIPVAVNVSAIQFGQGDFLNRVAQALDETRMDPTCLELEVTETVVMRNPAQAAATLHALKAMGVSIAIDDFGTGYSSLSYLQRFPIDRLKIDRSFVGNLTTDAANRIVIRSVIGLGKNLGLRVIAEGVETEEEAAQLRMFGCDEVQGFHFSRPLPPRQFWQIAAR